MDNGILFSKLKLNGKPLSECEMVYGYNQGDYRLYVDKYPDNHTFYAIAIEFTSCASSDIWACPHLEVEPLFNVTAYFDGVRHLEFNREAGDMAGYIYYPNMDGLIEMFNKVREIELEICRNCE